MVQLLLTANCTGVFLCLPCPLTWLSHLAVSLEGRSSENMLGGRETSLRTLFLDPPCITWLEEERAFFVLLGKHRKACAPRQARMTRKVSILLGNGTARGF